MTEQPEPLDYAGPPEPKQAPLVEWTWLGMLTGIPIALFALFAAVASEINGDRYLLAAKLLFPYSTLAIRLAGHGSVPLVLASLAQFPLYGATCGAAAARGRFWRVLLILAAAHLLASGLCLVVPLLKLR